VGKRLTVEVGVMPGVAVAATWDVGGLSVSVGFASVAVKEACVFFTVGVFIASFAKQPVKSRQRKSNANLLVFVMVPFLVFTEDLLFSNWTSCYLRFPLLILVRESQ